MTDRRRRYAKGLAGEWVAAVFLMAKGYRILEKRYRTPVGEVDLIAMRGGVLSFVEVKTHKNLEMAAWSVTPRQQARIVQAAQYWCGAHAAHAHRDISFDVILCAPWTWPRHMRNVFWEK